MASTAASTTNSSPRCGKTCSSLERISLVSSKWRCRVNGGLTSLQYYGDGDETSLLNERGFRRFVVQAATKLGITGFIRRHSSSNVEIWYEGTEGEMDRFQALLAGWLRQELVGEVVVNSAEENYVHRRYNDFSIHRNFSNLATMGRRQGIVTGKFSEDLEMFEEVSVSSADTTEARS